MRGALSVLFLKSKGKKMSITRQQRLNIRNLYCPATREEFLRGIEMAIEAEDLDRAGVLREMFDEYEAAGEFDPHPRL